MDKKPIRICFAAGDVGGARAILPIAKAAFAKGNKVLGLKNGVFYEEGDPHWQWLSHEETLTLQADLIIYATSVLDTKAFQTALAGREKGIPLLHVLDNWSSYDTRLWGENLSGQRCKLIPEKYAVMDSLALKEAIQTGVPAEILRITGQPSISKLAIESTQFSKLPDDKEGVLFVSEPVAHDSGDRLALHGRGYDEVQVSEAFAKAYAKVVAKSSSLPLLIAPHPREDWTEVTKRWTALAQRHEFSFRIVSSHDTRKALHKARAVIGMTSIMLYESWLLGKPTLSFQPDLRFDQLAWPRQRECMQFCTDISEIGKQVERLLNAKAPIGPRVNEMDLHTNAALSILSYGLESS